MKKLLFPALAFTLLFSACEKTDAPNTLSVTSTAEACTLYPLTIGNTWVYQNTLDGNIVDTTSVADTTRINKELYYAITSTESGSGTTGLFKCDLEYVYQLIAPADTSISIPKDILNRIVKGKTFIGDTWQDVFEFDASQKIVVNSTVTNIHQDYLVKGFNFKVVLEVQAESKTIIGTTTSPSTFITRWIAADVGLVKSRSQDDDGLNFDIVDFKLK